MPDTPEKKPKKLNLSGDDKVVWTTIHGRNATHWRTLLREEGGTEAHHVRNALEGYIKAKGYDGR